MSRTCELIEPAGPTMSMLRHGTTRSVSSTRMCGVATSDCNASAVMLVELDDMPSGVKMRRATKSSHDVPETSCTTSPAAMYMRFW